MVRFASMLGALALGAFLPELSPWSWLIRWFLVAMLFVAFLGVDPREARFSRSHAKLLLVWPFLAAGGWLLLRPFGEQAAFAGFLAGATPTATAAPVITGLLGGRIGFVTVSVLGSNLVAALALPAALSFMPGAGRAGMGPEILIGTVVVVGAPFAAAQALRFLAPSLHGRLRVLRRASFPLWIAVLVLASARTSGFLEEHPEIPRSLLFAVFAGTGCICAANFLLGRLAGRPGLELEAGQSLGQKNTMLTLWLGLAVAGPVAALGPASYVVWHNLWNGVQLARRRR